ncbi:MAG: hypothetical protein CVV64_18095 [Candidatus Wallbacteria bacterium HGW-Wallbacteria-1]|jgi:ADP-ribosylglycohydrolase|uniref:ADP-ribosylglycohydrolase family protein n=1 Tax=Candidatus Wallbacteria bacterium HGW-Wallbacteria-1 TaxID=2013854 RepID=A0A2N1PJU6_9BACT|nr:MAG: hypothetical protein CVV64_18095 [Candidatus Wallbacteria bacterium HGW-Wallbacteria-1]
MPSRIDFAQGGAEFDSRVRGLFIGGFIGDALGFPFEGLNASAVSEILGRADDIAESAPLPDFRPHPSGDFEPGTITDDSQMTLVELHTHAAESGASPDAIADALGNFWTEFRQEQRLVINPGYSLSTALTAISNGTPWNRAAAIRGRAGCGALVRIAPSAIWPWPQEEPDVRGKSSIIAEHAAITHLDTRSTACCIAFANILDTLVRGGNPVNEGDAVTLIQQTAALVEEINQETAAILREITELYLAEEGVIRERVTQISMNNEGDLWVSPYCVAVFAAALISWLRHRNTPSRALIFAIGFGGITESICSLTGQLLGAALGSDLWPDSMVQSLCGPGETSESITAALEQWLEAARLHSSST